MNRPCSISGILILCGIYLLVIISFYMKDDIIHRSPAPYKLVDRSVQDRPSIEVAETESLRTEELSWGDWEKEQERRKATVREVCGGETVGVESQREKYRQLANKEDKLSHLLVDDKHRAIYCYIPKTGCSSWKKLWMVLRGDQNLTRVEDVISRNAHEFTNNMTLITNTSKIKDVIQKLENYTKLIAVRHPTERLISAYFNKIHRTNGVPDFQKLVLPSVKKTRQNATCSDISWDEFISFVSGPNGRKNEHWLPYNMLCHPCDIPYDVIVKLQTITEDSEKFLRLIGAPEDLHYPYRDKKTNTSLSDHYERNLTSEVKAGILKYFRQDFTMFDYNSSILQT